MGFVHFYGFLKMLVYFVVYFFTREHRSDFLLFQGIFHFLVATEFFLLDKVFPELLHEILIVGFFVE